MYYKITCQNVHAHRQPPTNLISLEGNGVELLQLIQSTVPFVKHFLEVYQVHGHLLYKVLLILILIYLYLLPREVRVVLLELLQKLVLLFDLFAQNLKYYFAYFAAKFCCVLALIGL